MTDNHRVENSKNAKGGGVADKELEKRLHKIENS